MLADAVVTTALVEHRIQVASGNSLQLTDETFHNSTIELSAMTMTSTMPCLTGNCVCMFDGTGNTRKSERVVGSPKSAVLFRVHTWNKRTSGREFSTSPIRFDMIVKSLGKLFQVSLTKKRSESQVKSRSLCKFSSENSCRTYHETWEYENVIFSSCSVFLYVSTQSKLCWAFHDDDDDDELAGM